MSRLGRLRAFGRRARGLPSQVDGLAADQQRVLHETRTREEEVLRRLDGLARALADETARIRAEQQADTTAATRHLLEQVVVLRDQLTVLESGVEAERRTVSERERTAASTSHEFDVRLRDLAHQIRVAQEMALADGRDAAADALLAGLTDGPVPLRRPGLSVVTTSWNHAGWLDESMDSARAVLDALPHDLRGEHLVLDDASTDETGAVLARRLDDDPSLRVLRSPVNLGLGRARNLLLAACPTTHAVVLDADNRLLPDGVTTAYEVARTYASAITFGQVIASDDAGRRWDAFAYAPSAASLPGGLCFDSMCVVDVAAVESLGGYTTDPQLEGAVDDLELLLRTLRRGLRVGYVPTVLGRYRLGPQRLSALVADHLALVARLRRRYLYDDPDLDSLPIFGAHPATGVLWAARSTGLEPRAADVRHQIGGDDERPRIAILASGGVGNLGDDAITAAVVRRVLEASPGADVDLFTDRDRPETAMPLVPWGGTVTDVWRGLDPELVAQGAAAEDVDAEALLADGRGAPVFDPAGYDAVVIGGGGFLSSPFARDLLVPRVAVALACAAVGTPVVWTGQGVGPCSDDELGLVAAAARTAAAFGCRDPLGAASLDPLAPGRATVVGDDAMAVVPDPDVAVPLLDDTDGPWVVLHVRDAEYLGPRALEAAADCADRLAAELGGVVVGLAVNDNRPSEHEVLVRLARTPGRRSTWATVDASGRPGLARAVLGRAEAVLAHSYHVALWALLEGTPTLLVTGSDYYRQKAAGLSGLAGFPGSVGIEPDVLTDEFVPRLGEVGAWLAHSRLADAAVEVEAWWGGTVSAALKS